MPSGTWMSSSDANEPRKGMSYNDGQHGLLLSISIRIAQQDFVIYPDIESQRNQ